jgi:hypothetical protein
MEGELTVRGSTLVADQAIGGTGITTNHGKGIGGAVFNLSGTFTAVGSTFAKNSADYDGESIYNLIYDENATRSAQTTVRDTIVADGVGSQFDLASDKTTDIVPGPNLGIANAAVSEFNLVRTLHALGSGTITGNPITTDPQLGSLTDNGGPTRTMAPAPTSPVIDAGSAVGLTTDQRGQPRPFDFASLANAADGADIGAFEAQSACPGADIGQSCFQLAVSIAGAGTGLVGGGGIACPGTCLKSFVPGTAVTLTAVPASGSTFAGWSGACGGTGACHVTLSADRAVTAAFAPATDRTPPKISSAAAKPSTFAVESGGRGETPVKAAKKPAKGTTFHYKLSEAARVVFTIKRPLSGRKVGKNCIRPTAKNRKRKKCTRYAPAGRFAVRSKAKADSHRFKGRIGSKKLTPGRYRVRLVATDAAGNHSRPTTFAIRVVRLR